MKYLLFLVLMGTQLLMAQNACSPYSEMDEENPISKWEFSGNFGYYKASSYHAEFYNAAPYNVNNLNYVFGNTYWYNDIKNDFTEYANRDSFWVEEYPTKMKYNAAMMGGFSLRYNRSEMVSFNLHFNFAKLHLIDIVNFQVYPAYPGEVESYVPCEVFGTESRSNIDFTVMFAFSPEKPFSAIAELGFNLNNALVKESRIRILGYDYNLVDVYGSGGYVPNTGNDGFTVRQGGIGFGLSSAAGIRYRMSPDFAVEWVMNLYYTRVKLEGYEEEYGMHYGTLLRLVMSSRMISQL